jgi:luciferase family oxidoreductase group 1
VKLSVVDQSPVSQGMTPAEALRKTIDLARHCDRLGYTRYWIAEHHGMEVIATSVPEVMIGLVAEATRGIRVGSGAVLLPHYSPLKVAETFRLLHALFPGRIDLGLGRAPGGEALEAFALRRTRDQAQFDVDDFPNQLVELLAFLRHDFPEDHPFARIHVTPDAPGEPDVWLLGSSAWSAMAAGRLSLPYCFAHFINPGGTRLCIDRYRAQYEPSPRQAEPRAVAAVGVICAESDIEAEHIGAVYRAMGRRIRLGIRAPLPTPEEALRELAEGPVSLPGSEGEWPRVFIGGPDKVKAELEALAEALKLDEIMAVTITHDHEDRVRSYRLLAEAFALEPREES